MPRRSRHGRPVIRELPSPVFDQSAETRRSLPLRRDPDAAQHLENLRAALSQEAPELFVKLERPAGYPARLRISRPDSGDASETIHHRAGDTSDAPGRYVWSWGQVLCSAEDPSGAATQALRVLGRRSQ